MRGFAAALFASVLVAVRAHGTVDAYDYNGKHIVGYLPYVDPFTPPLFPDRSMRALAGNGPVSDVNSPDIACGIGSKPAKLVETLAAGTTMQLHWTPWDPTHRGPVINWLARVPDGIDVRDWDLSGAQWFKISQAGWDKDKGWASVDQLFAQDHNWPVTIPAQLKAGQYVLRHELVALHMAFSYPGSQFYPNCIQLEVTGGGDKLPTAGTVSLPGGYKPDEPGMVFNIYTEDFAKYVIPGGPVWDGVSSSVDGSAAPAPAPAPASSSAPAPASSSAPAPADTSVPASSSAAAPADTAYPTDAYPSSYPTDAYPSSSPTSSPVADAPTPSSTPVPAATPQTLVAANPPSSSAVPAPAPTATGATRCRRSNKLGRRGASAKKSRRAHRAVRSH